MGGRRLVARQPLFAKHHTGAGAQATVRLCANTGLSQAMLERIAMRAMYPRTAQVHRRAFDLHRMETAACA